MTTYPYSEEAEASIVARALMEPRQIPVVVLSPDDFYLPEYKKAWAAMRRMSDAGRNIDIVTLRAEGVELSDPLGRLTTAHRVPLSDYAEIIRGHAFQRRVLGALDEVTRKVYGHTDPIAILADVQTAWGHILQGVDDGRLLSNATVIDQFVTRLEHHVSGLTYGLRALDEALQPAVGGDMIVVAARPAVGKTALMESVSDHMARGAKFPVLFASLEMSHHQLTQRAVSRYGGIDAERIVRGTLSEADLDTARATLETRRGVNLWYLDDSSATTADVRSAAARVKLMHGGLTAIVIDYLQLLSDRSGGESEVIRVTRISRQVKQMAREFDVPVIVASQLNRGVEQREDKRPKLSDIRESGAIEQDADVVLALWAPSYSEREIGLLKNRNGPAGDWIPVRFTPSRVRYE